MNPNKEKLLAEKKRNIERIERATAVINKLEKRNKEINETIISLENIEYGNMARTYNVTPEEFAELLKNYKKG